MLTGLNHITIAVTDLDVSLDFYVRVLGMKAEVKWNFGAYLTLADLWICLSKDVAIPSQDYSHIAFTCSEADFKQHEKTLIEKGFKQWKENASEGLSLYLLDPDGHKLEIHAGDLNTRLSALKDQPYEGLVWLNNEEFL